jgi:hypothetical protein
MEEITTTARCQAYLDMLIQEGTLKPDEKATLANGEEVERESGIRQKAKGY